MDADCRCPALDLGVGGSAIDLGLIWALQFGPIPLLAPVVGVYADRLSKRRTLVSLQLLLASQAFAFALLVSTGQAAVPQVFFLSAIFGLANAAEMPVRQSFIAELVPKRDLVNGIVLHQAAFNITRMVGPAAAGLIIITLGYAVNFGLAALGSLLAVVMLASMQAPPRPTSVARGGVAAQLAAAARVSVATPAILWPLVILGAASTFGTSFQAILPIYIDDVLHLDRALYGSMLAALGVGAVLGALPMAYISERRALPATSVAAMALAATLVALAVNRSMAWAFVLLVLNGFAFLSVLSCVNLTIQSRTSHDMRGRLMGQYVAIFHGGVAIGSIFVGGLAEILGTPVTMAVSAAILLTVALVAGPKTRNRSVLTAERGDHLTYE